MRKLFALIFTICLISVISHPLSLTMAESSNPGPAGVAQIEYIFGRVICITVPLGYTALLIVLIIAGFKYLISGGEAKAVTSAHQTVTWGILGILFLAIAWLVLLLIQNFTEVKVTQFTLSSLPGVQGFTGSCWGPPPEAPNPAPPQLIQPPVQSSQPQNPSNPFSWPTTVCHDSSEWFVPAQPINMQQGSNGWVAVYTKADDLAQLANVLTTQSFVTFVGGTVDGKVYIPKITSAVGSAGGYGKFRKGQYPAELRKAAIISWTITEGLGVPNAAKELAAEHMKAILSSIDNPPDFRPSWTPHQENLGVTDCPDADFYPIRLNSPLIYIYPQKPTAVSVRINSPIVSSAIPLNNNAWHLAALPDGTLVTIEDGKKYPYIPYEFIRSDFKRPNKGFVIKGDNVEQFLKDNLWKKLGLKDNEIVDYWIDTKPRIKPSPYYFVSLIDRSEIDRVLPMEINPKPDTIIRNMTYILPLSAPFIPQPLEEEKLIAPKRNGFTVLENGVFTDGF